jgi:calcineurin-like phosphoesterase family protein
MVRPQDTVWHLGDFAFRCEPSRRERIFKRLNGRKHLVVGNHDDAATLSLDWESAQQIAEASILGQRVVLCHYAMRVWPRQAKGAIHLFGHSHARLGGTARSLDVGVDAWDYRPTELASIAVRLSTIAAGEADWPARAGEPRSG